MSLLNTRRDGKTWWQIAYQGWILPQNEGFLSGESFSRYLVYIVLLITIVTLCTNVLLFLYVLCRIWWYWRDVLVLRRTPESDSWVRESADGRNSRQYSSGVMIWSVKSPPTVSLYWRLVFVTFGCVTLPRRFRLGIVFGGEVWRAATHRQWFRTGNGRHCSTYFLYCTVFRFCTLVHFRCCWFEKVGECGHMYN